MHMTEGSLQPFPINFSHDGWAIESGKLGKFDHNGIPLVDYDRRYRDAGIRFRSPQVLGSHYTPVTIAIYAISILQRNPSLASPADANRFFELVDWLVENFTLLNDEAGVWMHNFPVPFEGGLPVPYPSGLAQALGVSLLLRAAQLRPESRYIATAKSAFGAITIDIRDGGVACEDGGFYWIEEWPSEPRSHVLNGFAFALIAIHDFEAFFGNKQTDVLWSRCLETLKANINSYDSGYGSRYDLTRCLVVSDAYHRLHISLLRVIARLSGDGFFNEVAEKWSEYLKRPLIYRRVRSITENMWKNSEYRKNKFRQIIQRFF